MMRKSFFFVIASSIVVTLFLFSQNNTRQTQATSNPITPQSQIDLRKENFAPARRMLLEKGVPFDPEILLDRDWRQKLDPAFTLSSEMQTSLRTGNRLEGVVIADKLILPERVELTGDLVIIANDLVFEGNMPVIEGYGKNVYVFPVEKTFVLGKNFDAAYRESRNSKEVFPEINQRISEKFDLPEKTGGTLTIRVNGKGYSEWLQERAVENSVDRGPCPHNVMICNGLSVGEGVPGDPGVAYGTVPPLPFNGPDGRCDWRHPNGEDGSPGEDGSAGPDNAGIGRQGPTGDSGGTIDFQITRPYSPNYVFESRGGQGGKGGLGGPGAAGDNAQWGGKGGDGQDCPCMQGGGGIGGDGKNGGRGGMGGRGGRGGRGGIGGNGGAIFVTAPYDFNKPVIALFNGGPPGIGGDGGFAGLSGLSGEGGEKGRALGNSNCPSSSIHDGIPGIKPLAWIRDERGPQGEDGNASGSAGSYLLTLQTAPVAGGCNGPINPGQYPSGCAPGLVATGGVCTNSPTFVNHCNLLGGYDDSSCGCFGMCDPTNGAGCSPVVVDVLGNGFSMTSAENGVMFDLEGNGTPRQFSWIAADSDDSWLALDRNNNGTIDSGRELFGNVTSQPPPPDGEEMNGFLALAQYDTAAFGGNSDGKINQQDAIFSRLRLWQDENHNGSSESCELKTLPEVGLRKIDLDYRSSRRTDEFGNQFRYKAKVRDAQDAQLGRWAWDVYLVLQH
jgi:hypothetical protein